jgi:beta-xylosidase
MWFFGWANADNNPYRGKPIGDAVYHARSRDLLVWEVYAGRGADGTPRWVGSDREGLYEPVVSALDPGFDGAIAGDPSVVYRNGRYWMAFSSVWFESHAETTPQHMYVISCIMGAVSKDGIHWTRTRKPILIWDKEYELRMDAAGGNFVRPPGYEGAYHRPSLMWDRDRWRIWFDYLQPGRFASMGCAENHGDLMDPAQWRVLRSGANPAIADWVNPSVVKVGRLYYSFSDAAGYGPEYGGDGRLTTLAVSRDGLDWRIRGHVRPEGMASSHVAEAFVERGRLHLFYSWKPPTVQGKPWDYRYHEIRAMRIATKDLPRLD